MSRALGERVLMVEVAGEPVPQGSVSAWVPTDRKGDPYRRAPSPRNPRGAIIVNLTSDNKALKAWRESVAAAASELLGDEFPLEGVGFTIETISFFKRPEGHYGTGRNAGILKPGAPAHPISQAPGGPPDVDKLLRSAMDALTGVVWRDDSQATDGITRKRYAVPLGAEDSGVRGAFAVWLNSEQAGADLPEQERARWVAGPAGQGLLL